MVCHLMVEVQDIDIPTLNTLFLASSMDTFLLKRDREVYKWKDHFEVVFATHKASRPTQSILFRASKTSLIIVSCGRFVVG